MCSDSTVRYKIFFDDNPTKAVVTEWYTAFLRAFAIWILEYPWYREQFNLRVVSKVQLGTHLSGSVDFGESIEDEWFIVWLLIEISKICPSAFIQVVDEDGEFLLIEGAEVLPGWLNPECSSNRIWINKGNMLMIHQNPRESITVESAVKLIMRKHSSTGIYQCFNDLLYVINRRLLGYPERLVQMRHVSCLILPYAAAASLSCIGPRLISSAADAWNSACQGDVVASRQWRNSVKLGETIFSTPVNICTKKSVAVQPRWPRLRSYQDEYFHLACTFNRCQYARLRSAPMPTSVALAGQALSAADRVAMELSAKLCAGLDIILLSATRSGANAPAAEWMKNSSADVDQSFTAFCHHLKELGYFKENTEGSRSYRELQHQAKAFYYNNLAVNSNDTPNQCDEPGSLLYTFLNRLDKQGECPDGSGLSGWLIDDFRAAEASGNRPVADDDDWMVVTPEQLDAMFTNYQEAVKSVGQPQRRLSSVTSRLQRFLKSKSSYKGVETRSFARSAAKRKQRVTTGASDNNSGSSSSSTDDEPWTTGCGSTGGAPGRRSQDMDGLDSDEAMDEYLEGAAGDDRRTPASGTGASQPGMADMMRSLVLEIDQIEATSRKAAAGWSYKSTVDNSYSDDDDDDEELADLYAEETTERLPSTIQLPSSASLSSASVTPQSSPLAPRRGLRLPASREPPPARGEEKQTLVDLLRQRIVSLNSGLTSESDIHHLKGGLPSGSDRIALSPSALSDAQPASSGEAPGSSSFAQYLCQMEQELSGQPANSGRVAGHSAPRVEKKQFVRNQLGVSVIKKTKRVQLAQAEDDDLDSDDLLASSGTNSEAAATTGGDSIGEADSAQVDHVVLANLCASAVGAGGLADGQPGGPAAQLLTSLGVPVHQLAAGLGCAGDLGGNDLA